MQVRDANLERVGTIQPRFLNLSATIRHNSVGEWTVTLPRRHPMVAALNARGSGIIVSARIAPGVWTTLLSGPMTTPKRTRNRDAPDGTFTFSGVTDDVILWDARAWPDPSNPDPSTQAAGYYVSSAADAESVLLDLVNRNIGPGAPAGRRSRLAQALTLAPNLHRGPAAVKSVRFPKLGVALGEVAAFARLGFRVVQAGADLVFEVRPLADRSGTVRLDMRNGTITSEESQVSPPVLTRALVAGQGEGADRTIRFVSTAEAADAEDDWGRIIEEFVDQRQTDDPDELDQAGMERLAEGGFTATAVKVVPGDDQTMRFVADWNVGDLVGVIVDGQLATAAATEAIVKAGPDRTIVGAAIGDVSRFEDTSATIARVDDTQRRAERLERTAEPSPPTDLGPIEDRVDDLEAAVVPLSTAYLPRQVLYYTANGTFKKADYPWLRAIRVRVQGGGGAGGGAAATSGAIQSFGQGGGGGGYAESFITDIASLAATITVTRGAGGTGVAAGGGNAGGTSSFGSLVVATGGTGGMCKPASIYTAYVSAGNGGVGTAGDLRIAGHAGGCGSGDHYGLCASGSGGGSVLGGGGASQGTGAGGGTMGGQAGGNYGGGGSGSTNNGGGSTSNRGGGAGAPGIVIVELYA